MSSQFGGARAVEDAWSGNTDGSGNLTVTRRPRPGFWTVLKVIGIASGSGNWLVQVGGQPAGIYQGPRADIGPFLVAPGEQVEISLTGAQPLSAVRGQLAGAQYGSEAEAVVSYSPSPNTVAVQTLGQSRVLGTMTVPAGANIVSTFPIQPGDQAVGFLHILGGGNAAAQEVIVDGHDSGNTYLDITAGNLVQIASLWAAPVDSNFDASVDCRVTATAAFPTVVRFVAFLRPVVTLVQAPPGEELSVTTAQSFPAPWQAPTAHDYAEASSVTTASLRAGVVGKTVRVFGWQLQIDQQGAGTTVAWLEDDTAASPGSRIGMITLTGAGGISITGQHLGAPLGVGHGLRLNVALLGTSAVVRALAGASQA